jgi:hypothetical protein
LMDEVAEYEMFGKNPHFIFHRTNHANRPIRGYHTMPLKRWPGLPIYIKEAFHRTFVDGLIDRENGRTTEIEWVRLLMRYRDEVVRCGCGFEYADGLWETNRTGLCPACGTQSPDRAILLVGSNKVILDLGKKLYEPHVDKFAANYDIAVANVIASRDNPNIWGIRNVTAQSFTITDAKGVKKIIPPNGVIPIVRNITIQFNDDTKGEIR